jgi:hypothetical protein
MRSIRTITVVHFQLAVIRNELFLFTGFIDEGISTLPKRLVTFKVTDNWYCCNIYTLANNFQFPLLLIL